MCAAHNPPKSSEIAWRLIRFFAYFTCHVSNAVLSTRMRDPGVEMVLLGKIGKATANNAETALRNKRVAERVGIFSCAEFARIVQSYLNVIIYLTITLFRSHK